MPCDLGLIARFGNIYGRPINIAELEGKKALFLLRIIYTLYIFYLLPIIWVLSILLYMGWVYRTVKTVKAIRGNL